MHNHPITRPVAVDFRKHAITWLCQNLSVVNFEKIRNTRTSRIYRRTDFNNDKKKKFQFIAKSSRYWPFSFRFIAVGSSSSGAWIGTNRKWFLCFVLRSWQDEKQFFSIPLRSYKFTIFFNSFTNMTLSLQYAKCVSHMDLKMAHE